MSEELATTTNEEVNAAQVDVTVDNNSIDALYKTQEVDNNESNDEANSETTSQENILETPSNDTTETESNSSETPEDESKAEVKEESDQETENQETETEAIEYKLELGEESRLGESFVEVVTDFAKANGLTNEAAQDLLDWQNDTVEQIFATQKADEEKQVEGWRQEVISDPELGGTNLERVSKQAQSVVKRYGSDDLVTMLNTSGLGNHKEVLRFLSDIGAAMESDSFHSGKEAPIIKSDVEIMYGEDK